MMARLLSDFVSFVICLCLNGTQLSFPLGVSWKLLTFCTLSRSTINTNDQVFERYSFPFSGYNQI